MSFMKEKDAIGLRQKPFQQTQISFFLSMTFKISLKMSKMFSNIYFDEMVGRLLYRSSFFQNTYKIITIYGEKNKFYQDVKRL